MKFGFAERSYLGDPNFVRPAARTRHVVRPHPGLALIPVGASPPAAGCACLDCLVPVRPCVPKVNITDDVARMLNKTFAAEIRAMITDVRCYPPSDPGRRAGRC